MCVATAMAEINLNHESQSTRGKLPIPKRRKVRKGTQSCWECKRRKSRCIFATPSELVCAGCKSRQTNCISQEFDDERPVARAGVARLDRVEAGGGRSRRRKIVHNQESNEITGSEPPVPPRPEGTSMPGIEVLVVDKHETLIRTLSAVWPNEHDLDVILSISVGTSKLLHGIICAPYSTYSGENAQSPRELLQLPPPGSHPVIFARKLLMLGAFLQGVPSNSMHQLTGLTVHYRDIMSCVVETAVRLVNSNDELVGSIEGIECIMMESMYHNDAGNLRRAYLVMRRAMTMAQMMGVHRSASSISLKILEPETRKRINPEYMWLRLVQSDRYLSMMLGLPQGSSENSFASLKVLEGCTPMERMERIVCVAAGRILQRNDNDMHDLAVTQEIDNLLQKASAYMPPKWWLIPNFLPNTDDDMHNFRQMIRLMNQLTHYHLLSQLHLPYLLRFSSDRKYDYSKITAVNASREILSRFVALRRFQSADSYCRGVDFLVFTASTALFLAHIDARRQRQVRADHGDRGTIFSFLAHQRLSDRGLMERTLDTMEDTARAGTDAIASNIARILRYLLAIEADTDNGARFSAASSGGDEGLECNGKVSDGGNILHIYIPYFGTIKIESGGASKSDLAAVPTLSKEDIMAMGMPSASVPDSMVSSEPLLMSEEQDEAEQRPLAATYCPEEHHTRPQSVNAVPQNLPPHFDPIPKNSSVLSFNSDGTHDTQLLVPWLTTDADGSVLQGVDMALFDNLFRDSVVPVETGGSWTRWL